MPSVSIQSLVDDALTELGVLSKGESADAPDTTLGLRRLNLIFDNWNAEHEAVYFEAFETFTLVPADQDITIGPTGSGAQWVTTDAQRPDALDYANLILTTSTPPSRLPFRIVDYLEWAAIPVRGVTTTVPSVLYYEPEFPLGVVHFWPVPSAAYDVELVTRGSIAQATISGAFNMPPGYQSAAMLTLAEDLATPFGRAVPAMTVKKAAEARARIFTANETHPTIVTCDAGMPSGARFGTTMNYLDRTIR